MPNGPRQQRNDAPATVPSPVSRPPLLLLLLLAVLLLLVLWWWSGSLSPLLFGVELLEVVKEVAKFVRLRLTTQLGCWLGRRRAAAERATPNVDACVRLTSGRFADDMLKSVDCCILIASVRTNALVGGRVRMMLVSSVCVVFVCRLICSALYVTR